ncbi:MAG: cellulase family glycosylhydrolase [Oscillospiraceae bacterium]|nr:cellulase family glycosylhydrolase [Oscillospiraceae bacterium]
MLRTLGFHRGINFGGWFSQCDYSREHLDSFITERDFETVAAWGLDHVRIPFDYNILENPDGSFAQEGFERLHRALSLCRQYGLGLTLDLHKTAGFSFDSFGESEHGFFESEDYQERFYRLWEALARQFGTYSDCVIFELLNEVTEARFLPAWNRILAACIARIRCIAPDTVILAGSYENNSVLTVSALESPADTRVVYNFHCYEPLAFTHQGAYWTPVIDPGRRVPFEEAGCSSAYFEALFSDALQKAELEHTCLYCGEYGVIDRVPPEETLAWFRAIHEVLEAHGIARCAWTYRGMDFSLTDPRLDSVRSELVACL